MYYRILVNKNGAKLFRTSRLHSHSDMLNALTLINQMHPAHVGPVVCDGQQYEVQVLCVDDEGVGTLATSYDINVMRQWPAASTIQSSPTQADPQA